jgi:predicted XRE-type DNA-binding protein
VRFLFCMPLQRKLKGHANQILNSRANDTKRLKIVSRKKSVSNVFLDLGFDPAEAAVLQMRATLMSDLRAYIEAQGLTQAEAALRLGIAQSRVSDLVRSKWEKFSLEMLITLETRLGRKVSLELAA